MSVSKLSDIIADVRVNPQELGKFMAYQDNVIQERFFEMFDGFIRELTLQAKTGTYVNGNMETAAKARLLHYLLTDNQLV